MMGTIKLIGALFIGAVLWVGLDKVASTLDGYGIHIPHDLSALKAKTVVTSDKDKVDATFASLQGIAAGQTPIDGLNAKAATQAWGLPKSVIGSCAKINDAHGKATYISRLDKHPLSTETLGLQTVVHLPDPEPVQVGLTEFKDPKYSQGCGILQDTRSPKDVKKLNDELQRQACEKTNDDVATLTDRRHDAEQTALTLLAPKGVDAANVKFDWQPVTRGTLPECEAVKK